MPILNPNSTNYVHPWEPNLSDLHTAMEYRNDGKPQLRVGLAAEKLIVEGGVTITEIEISNDAGTPIPISANTTTNSAANPIYAEISNDIGNPIPVSANTATNTHLNPVWVTIGDGPNLTAFGRLKTAEARVIGDYRYMYNQGTTPQMNDYTVNGGTVINDFTKDCVYLSATTTSGSRAVRQSKKYHPYISGTSNTGLLTFCMNTAKEGLVQAVGLFDDLNGIFFRMNGLTPEFVIRKAGVDNEVKTQTDWNLNKFSDADFSKTQILILDYQWLGVGRVRIGFVHNGFPIFCHQFTHDNTTTEVYMTQPSLPVRYEVYNSTSTVTTSTMMAICSAVYSEGSSNEISYTRSVSNGTTGVAAPNSADGHCVLAIRLQNTLVNKPNRSLANIKGISAIASADCRLKLVILPDASIMANNPTWSVVPGYSWCEYTTSTAMTSNWASANNYWVLKDTPVQGSGGNNSAIAITPIVENPTNAIYQNYDSTSSQVLALIVYGAATVRASFEWIEEK